MSSSWSARLAMLGTVIALGAGQLVSGGASGVSSDTAGAVALFRQAEQLLQAGSVDLAREKAEQALRLDPRSAAGLNLLGMIYDQEKKYDPAVKAFEKALAIAPHSAEIHNNLGNTFLLENNPAAAEREFRASLLIDPSSHGANYNLGVALLAEHRPKQAIVYLERIHPPGVGALFNLVQAYLLAGETKQALATASRLSDMDRNDVRIHFTLGVLLAANKQYEAGARELASADALRPGTFEILYNLGQTYWRNGNYEKAEQALGQALKLQPHSAETLYFLAQAFSSQRQDERALELLTQAHQIAPRNVDVIFLMARLSMRQSFYEDAIPLLEEGVRIDSKRPDLHAALGECYFTTGKIPRAVQEFRSLIKLDPSASSYAFMALYYRHLGRFDEAKKYLELGLQADPGNPACLYNMGYILSRQGKDAEAEKWLEKSIARDPNYSDALLELASIDMEKREPGQALPLLRRCVRLDPRPAPVYYKLAAAERDLHQMAAAERDLKVFETLSKDQNPGPYPFQHLFDYLDKRAGLPSAEKARLDLAELQAEVKLHPDQPRNLYLLAQGYLNLGRTEDALATIATLDQMSQGDFRTAVGVGVLLARYHLYTNAIAHFEQALKANLGSDDAWYDLARADAGEHLDAKALAALEHISVAGQGDPGYVELLGRVNDRLGHNAEAVRLFRKLAAENPDDDDAYLSLALAYLRSGLNRQARQTLEQGLARIPDSGVLFWGMGVVEAVDGETVKAERDLKKSVDLLPEWPASYSALGVLYYETGQTEKVRETLKEFMQDGPQGALDVKRIEQTLSATPSNVDEAKSRVLSPQTREQFLQLALKLAER